MLRDLKDQIRDDLDQKYERSLGLKLEQRLAEMQNDLRDFKNESEELYEKMIQMNPNDYDIKRFSSG